MTIRINGLTLKQAMLADIIWAIDSKEQLNNFINSLPEDVARDARLVIDMILAEVYDSANEVDQAMDVIDKIRFGNCE